MKKTKNIPDHEKLRVLILEDSPADAELIERELRKGGINFTSRLVDVKREFNKALAAFRPQVILSDFKLPKFDGLAALESARSKSPDIPFVFVSGSIGEERAIEMLAHGASDYIFKDNLRRLVPAVKRVIGEARLKQEKKLAEEKLRSHVEELRLLAEAADFFVQTNELHSIYDYLAEVIREISGADYLLLSVYDQELQAVRPIKIIGADANLETISRRFHIEPGQMIFFFKDMRPDDFSDFVSRRLLPVRDGLYGLANRKIARQVCRAIEKLLAIDAMFSMGFSWENQLYGGVTLMFKKNNDLKNQAQVENLLNQAAVSIKRLQAEQALLASETKYRTLVDQSPDGIFIIDLQGNFLSVNQAMCDGLKFSETEFLSMKIWDIVPEQYVELHKRRMADIMQGTAKNEAAEYMVTGKNGETHVVEILSAPFHKDNELIGLQGIAREITEKKKMEIRLRESEEYYRTLVETSPDAIVICDGGGRITFASQKAYEMFRLSATAKISGAPILEFVEPTEISRVQARLVEILSGRSLPVIREYRLQRRNGEPFWADVSSAPLRDHAGRNIGLLLICRDVSERKQAETALRESEEKYRLIADNTAETITLMDLNLRFTYVSPSIFKLRGFTVEEALNLTIEQTLTADSLLKIQQVFSEEMALEASGSADPKRSRTLELREYHKDGSIVWVENSLSFLRNPEGKLTGIIAVSKDISERKRAETIQNVQYKIAGSMVTAESFAIFFETIRKELGTLFDTTNFLVALYDQKNGLFSAPFDKNEKDNIPEWPAEKSLTGLVIRQKRSILLNKEQILQMSQAGTIELIGSRAESWLGVPLLINDKILGALVVQSYDQADAYDQNAINIMEMIASQASVYIERTRATMALKESESRLRLTYDAVNDGFWDWNISTGRVVFNPNYYTMLGYEPYSFPQDYSSWKNLIHPDEIEKIEWVIKESIASGSAFDIEFRARTCNGDWRWIRGRGRVMELDAEGHSMRMMGTHSDISERKQAEDLIRASLKEKEVLLQEIHHRVKNNLQIISGLLTLQAEQAAGKSLAEIFRESQDRIRSIALIHEKLYRSHNLAEIAFDEYLRTLVENLFISQGVSIGTITIKYEMEPVLFTIEKAIPLGLIVNELVTNALKHAFPDGRRGEIRIGLHFSKQARFTGIKTESGTLYKASQCELIVADNGIGLPAGLEPAAQKSLGMNLVVMLAKQIRAEFKFKTGPGAEFRLLFPGQPANENVKDEDHDG